jgi:hypothetical protein
VGFPDLDAGQTGCNEKVLEEEFGTQPPAPLGETCADLAIWADAKVLSPLVARVPFAQKRDRPRRGRDQEGTGRGMEPFVLLRVAEGPAHGYELAQSIAALGFRRAADDPSVVYKVLRGLEDRGYLI